MGASERGKMLRVIALALVAVAADVLGPSIGNCTQWNFNYCKDEPCSIYDGIGCESCIEDPFCGYCGSSGRCIEGTSNGPLMDECAGDWMLQDCPETNFVKRIYPGVDR